MFNLINKMFPKYFYERRNRWILILAAVLAAGLYAGWRGGWSLFSSPIVIAPEETAQQIPENILESLTSLTVSPRSDIAPVLKTLTPVESSKTTTATSVLDSLTPRK